MELSDDIQHDLEGGYTKLTEWEKEPTVRQLKQDLSDAKSAHESHVADVKRWLDNLYVTGSAKLPKQKNRSSVTPKLIRKQAEWRYTSLSEPFLSTEDIYNTKPKTHMDKERSDQAGMMLNYQFNTQLRKVKFIDELVRTIVDEGTAVVRVGWDYEEEVLEGDFPVTELQLEGEELVERQIGMETREEIRVLKNQPTLQICHYENVIPDPSCEGDLDKAGFVIYRFETNLSELKKAGKYKNLDKINLNDASPLAEPDHATEDESGFNFKDHARKKITAYEYWGYRDIDGSGVAKPIVATWVGNTIIQMEENPFPDQKIPFVFIQYLPVRKSLYGQPDGELLEENQQIVGAVTRGMIDIMGRAANGQMGMMKGMLDVVNRRKFDRGQDYEYNANTNPKMGIYEHTFPQIPQSAQFMLELQNHEAESLTGIKAFATRGLTGQALGQTATAARTVTDATTKRETGILRRIAEGMKDIGYKIMAMNGEFLSEQEIIRVTDEDFVMIPRENLVGQYDIDLTISTPEADNEKAQELSFMLQTMGNNLDFSFSQMILAEIARLRKMPVLAKKIEEYQPQPNPVEQKKLELEIALLEAQVFNERNKGFENEADIGLKKAKTQTELSKSRNMDSKTDQQDLDFLEQDSGIKDQREINLKELDHKIALDQKAADKLLEAEKTVSQKTSG